MSVHYGLYLRRHQALPPVPRPVFDRGPRAAAVAASRKPLPRTEPFGGRAVWGCNLYEIGYEVVVWNK